MQLWICAISYVSSEPDSGARGGGLVCGLSQQIYQCFLQAQIRHMYSCTHRTIMVGPSTRHPAAPGARSARFSAEGEAAAKTAETAKAAPKTAETAETVVHCCDG